MSDSRRTYRAIKKAILQLYPTKPQGNLARHLTTLVGLVSGIVLSKSCQLPKIASKVPGDVHPDSRTKQFSRWVNNEAITFDLYFLPFIGAVVDEFGGYPAAGVGDGWERGRPRLRDLDGQCAVWRARLARWPGWSLRGRKGTFRPRPTSPCCEKSRRVSRRPRRVILLGDGEFDSPELQAEATGYGWDYVCRTAKNIQISADGETWSSLEDLGVTRGSRVFRKGVQFTKQAYGPVMVIAWWGRAYTEPIYLVSNLSSVQAACDWYRNAGADRNVLFRPEKPWFSVGSQSCERSGARHPPDAGGLLGLPVGHLLGNGGA